MKNWIKSVLAMVVVCAVIGCDGGSSDTEEKNKQDVAALSSQLAELEAVVDDLTSTIAMLASELVKLESNSEAAQSISKAIAELTEKVETIGQFKSEMESKISSGEITSITDDVMGDLDSIMSDVSEVGDIVGELVEQGVEFSNPALAEKLEELKEGTNSWLESADSASQGFGQPEPVSPVKVKKVAKIQVDDDESGDIHTLEFEYDAEGRVSKMKEVIKDEVCSYTFDYSTTRKILVTDNDGASYTFSTDNKGRVVKIVYNDRHSGPVTISYEYDSNGNVVLKTYEHQRYNYTTCWKSAYSNNKFITYSLEDEPEYGTYDFSSFYSHNYSAGTINMDINMFVFGCGDYAVFFVGPHFGKYGDYFMEKCANYHAPDYIPPYETETADPNYFQTLEVHYTVGPEEEFLPLTYTFDADNCPVKIESSVTVQEYKYEVTYSAGESLGEGRYAVEVKKTEPVSVGLVTYKRNITITYTNN